MRLTEVRPYPQTGQWWASKNPLMLHQVVSPGECCVLKVWDPVRGIQKNPVLPPLSSTNWVYLGFSERISVDPYFTKWKPLRRGDAFHTPRGEVFFIGEVNPNEKTVWVLSDEEFYLRDTLPIRLQQGPPDPADTPASSYERLLAEDSIHESVPQSREVSQAITELEILQEP